MTEKRLPDTVGAWYNQQGHLLFIGHLYEWRVSWADSDTYRSPVLRTALQRADVEPGRWKRAERPYFEPEAPFICYTKVGWVVASRGYSGEDIRSVHGTLYNKDRVEVVPPSANSPELVDFIEGRTHVV